MRKLISLAIVGAIIGGMVAASPASARVVSKSSKFFLRDTDGCGDANFLSKKDGEDFGCWQIDSALNEAVIDQAALLDRSVVQSRFDARDGVPLVLDAKKAITGTIYTDNGSCFDPALDPRIPPIDCAPVGIGGGRPELDITVQGFVGGREVLLGTQAVTFESIPGDPHATEVDIELDDALHKKKLTGLSLTLYFSGAALFHSVIELEDPASFINVPTLVKK